MKKLLLLMIPVLVTAVSASEMLVNGDFEQELTVGWTFTDSGTGTHTCDRATDYHPDPDYEAQTYQYDNPGWARLGQTVDVPSPLLALSFWAKFEYSGGSSSSISGNRPSGSWNRLSASSSFTSETSPIRTRLSSAQNR